MEKAISQEVIYGIYTFDLDIFILVLIEACSVSVCRMTDRVKYRAGNHVQNESSDASRKRSEISPLTRKP